MAPTEDRWLLDTSVLVDLLRGVTLARDRIDSLGVTARTIPVIAAAELLAGCRTQAEQRVVEREIDLYEMVWVTQEVSQLALQFYKHYRLSHGVGFLDCLIAATASRNGLRLATLNLKHFAPFPDLPVERPY